MNAHARAGRAALRCGSNLTSQRTHLYYTSRLQRAETRNCGNHLSRGRIEDLDLPIEICRNPFAVDDCICSQEIGFSEECVEIVYHDGSL